MLSWLRSFLVAPSLLVLALVAGCGTDPLGLLRDAGFEEADGEGVAFDSGFGSRDAVADEDALAVPDVGPSDSGIDDVGTPSLDATPADVGAPDLGGPDAGPADAGVQACGFDVYGPADRPRVVLVGQPFTSNPPVNGTVIRTMLLPVSGTLTDVNTRIDVGFRPSRIEFVPSGTFAIAIGEDGDVASLRVVSETNVSVVDHLALPRGGFKDLRILSDGQTILAMNSDVGATSGIYTLHIDCDGRLSQDSAAFYNLRLADSLAFAGSESLAVVLGGQAVFAPVDNNDLRLFSRVNGRFTEIAAFDLWSDAIDAARIAVSPDGHTLIVPNGSPFSAQGATVMIASVGPTTINSPRILTNMGDAREALFSPDGQTALVTLLEPGKVVVFADRGAGFVETERKSGIGLAEQMAMVSRGSLSGRVLLPSVDGNGGPNIASLQITGPGVVTDLGQVNIGMSSEDIPEAIAVTP
ncbi:MAG: hypothetical protein U1E65_35315 [Myxococcota bacterium]